MIIRAVLCTILVFCMQSSWALDADFAEHVRKSGVLAEEEEILLQSDTYFYPGKKGFSLFSGGKDRVKAYFLLTQSALYVLDRERNSDRYEVIHQENYQNITSVEVVGNSIALRLVTEGSDSENFNSYELLDGRNAISTNSSRTEDAKDLIMTAIQGLDPRVASSSHHAEKQIKTIQALEERIERLEKLQATGVVHEEPMNDPECNCVCPPQ